MSNWLTLRDLQTGIEKFLLDGPKPLWLICNHAAQHGVYSAQAIRSVHALRDAGRLEMCVPRARQKSATFQLSDWNAAALRAELNGGEATQ